MMTSSLGEAFPRQLARAVGVDTSRLHALMHGDGVAYAKDLSLVALGMVELRETPHGRVYAITASGRRKARQLSAREVRRERARVANKPLQPQVNPHLEPEVPTGEGAPAQRAPPDTQSWRWSTEA